MWGIKAFTYEADTHCPAHARERFGLEGLLNGTAIDNEGNTVHPVFEWDEHPDECADCLAAAIAAKHAA